jgi:rubrerythrin
MKLTTTSEIISFVKKLEQDSASFYEEIAQKNPNNAELFLSFVKENEKNIIHVERVYYGVISDALEGCFSFNIESEEYSFRKELGAERTYAESLDRAIELENNISKFYLDAAEQSKSLMADIPRAFKLIAKKREYRQSKLKLLLN